MVTKPFLAARIPEDLNTKLEEHSASTGEGRTQAVINALAKYLNFTPESKNEESASDRLSLLEKKVADLERLLKEPKQISMALDVEPSVVKEPAPLKITTDNKTDNEKFDVIDSSVIFADDSIDNNFSAEANQEELADKVRQERGEFIGRMKTQDVPNLLGLENEDPKKIKVKLNNTKNQKSQFTQVGRYFIELAKPGGVAIAEDITPKPKKQELLWDVYSTKEP